MGSDCRIASGCKFIDHDHGLSRRDLPVAPQVEGAEAEIFLEEDVWLGANVIVLKGTRIARGAVLAACSVVTNNEPPYEMWAGVPARKIGERPVEP
jgi:acetyltransferase-like isoleucine patch superfamily enzyme